MIEARHIYKTYRPRFLEFWKPHEALRGMNFTAKPGQVTGLVGPNGAGKTTLFKVLVGLEPIDQGEVLIHGIDSQANPEELRGKIALLPEDPAFPKEEKGIESLTKFGIMQGLGHSDIQHRIEVITDKLDLSSFLTKMGKQYSRGQAVRMSLARLHLMDAHTYIFDEPTVGLDFESAAKVRAWIRELAGAGHTVVIASHIMHDIQGLCQTIVGIQAGQLVDATSLKGWRAAVDDAQAWKANPLSEGGPLSL